MSEEKISLGKYVLEKKLAQGGMAEIFLANQEGPGGFQKRLVIKRILPHLADDKKFVDMFLDEARLAAQFNHANIVQIFDLGEVDDQYFIAMEFIDGHDLEAVIDRAAEFGKRVPSPVAARIIADSLAALHYAHTFQDPTSGEPLNLVHRDVSPQNLLVNTDGVVKLVDFGVAKARTSSNKTQTGAVKGKFSYMAPEQIAGEELDGRCDVFAMGIVLYELLLGVRPFGEHSDLMAITAIVNQAPKDPREIDDNFPPELEKILYRALAKSRDERFSSASEMQRELEVYLQTCGTFISTREVATYIADLFSDSPNLDAVGLGATPTQDVNLAELRKSASTPQTVMEQRPNTGPQDAIKEAKTVADAPIPATEAHDAVPPAGGGKSMMAVVIVLIVLVLGGGALLAFMMMDGEERFPSGSSDSEEAKADTTAESADASAENSPDVAAEEKADTAIAAKPDTESAADVAATTKDTAVAAADTKEPAAKDMAAPAAKDVAVAAADVKPDTTKPPKKAGGLEGEPVQVAAAKHDVSHIRPEDLPGSSAAVAAGFGEVKFTTNLKARIYYKGQRVGTTPATVSFPKGDHEVRFVSKDKNNPAEKRVVVHVFEGRKYEVETKFHKGTLKLSTSPARGFKVKLDGVDLGETPIKSVDVYQGSHKLELIDTATNKKHKFSVTIVPGDNVRSIDLRR